MFSPPDLSSEGNTPTFLFFYTITRGFYECEWFRLRIKERNRINKYMWVTAAGRGRSCSGDLLQLSPVHVLSGEKLQ